VNRGNTDTLPQEMHQYTYNQKSATTSVAFCIPGIVIMIIMPRVPLSAYNEGQSDRVGIHNRLIFRLAQKVKISLSSMRQACKYVSLLSPQLEVNHTVPA
jgi:hypothetical protein